MSQLRQDRLRLGAVCVLSFSVSLPIALISLSKLVLACTFMWLLAVSKDMRRAVTSKPLLAHRLIYLAIAAFTVSILWSAASESAISKSVVQHGNLLLIPLVFFMIRTREEAARALQTFMVGQLLLLMGSWALYLHLPVPWDSAVFAESNAEYAVFSSHLDQSIMTAVFAALTWHLRELLSRSLRSLQVVILIALASFAVFGIFVGRTGYLIALALATLAIFWVLPRSWRIGALLVPVVLAALVSVIAPQALQRTQLVRTEVVQHMQVSQTPGVATSSGIRINFWKNALLAIEKSPWIGHGAGSWGQQFDALQPESQRPGYAYTVGNPHQEYLLWGVELGVPGIALLICIFAAIWQMSCGFERQAAHAAQSVLVAIMLACLVNCSLTDALIGDFLCLALALTLCLGLKPAKSCDLPV